MNQSPIFIVGVQRSGTTLLAALLAAHSRLSCGPETHFFRRLAETRADLICAPEHWPTRALEFLCSIRHSGFEGAESRFLVDKYGLTAADLEEDLRRRSPSLRSVLCAVTESQMRREKKQRWVEKTPDHMRHVATIRRYFPDSPIVRIVRDPRDVALSLVKVPWGARTLLDGCRFWRSQDDAGAPFFEHDQLALTVRFEDLVGSPEETLQRICQFIGEEFEPSMTDTSRSGKALNSCNVRWKENASRPLDSGRVFAWRSQLTESEILLAESILADRLAQYDYPRQGSFVSWASVFPKGRLSGKFSAAAARVAQEGVRFWPASADEAPCATVFLGDPAADGWFSEMRLPSPIQTLVLGARILWARARGESLFWLVDDEVGERWTGYSSAVLKRLLRPYRVSGQDRDRPGLEAKPSHVPL